MWFRFVVYSFKECPIIIEYCQKNLPITKCFKCNKKPFWNLICDVRASARGINILLSSVHGNRRWFIFNRFHSEMVWIFDTEHTKFCDIKVFVSHFRIFLSFPCSIDGTLPACQYLTAVSHCLFHSKNTFLGNMFDFKICLCLRSRYFYSAG